MKGWYLIQFSKFFLLLKVNKIWYEGLIFKLQTWYKWKTLEFNAGLLRFTTTGCSEWTNIFLGSSCRCTPRLFIRSNFVVDLHKWYTSRNWVNMPITHHFFHLLKKTNILKITYTLILENWVNGLISGTCFLILIQESKQRRFIFEGNKIRVVLYCLSLMIIHFKP